MLHIPGLYIAPSEGRGRGVFTADSLKKGDVIEICPVILIPPEEISHVDDTIFHDYYFHWPQPKGAACVALGYGSIYNHSHDPNAEIVLDIDNLSMQFHCTETIQPGDEIFIDYSGGDGEKTTKLWFKSI